MPANEHYPGYPLPSVLTGHALRRVCFEIPDNDEYKRAFWDKVGQLAIPTFWQRDDYADTRNQIAAEYWEQLLYANLVRFIEDPDCGVPQPNTCQTYPPTAPFIQWFPNDPVYTPGFVGEGYNNPAWYFATLASNIAYGSQYGDVITSLDRFPPGSLPEIIPASGLPRFRINVNGIGVVKAKLVNMFAGSLIQTTVDDDIGTLNFVDVAKDEVAAPPETNGELIVEFDLTTTGAHHIDFIVISWVNSSVPFLHHGGGLRQVELCGFDEMPIYSPPFRFTEACGLEFYDGEAWQAVTGWTDFAPTCFQGLPGADGADGATLFIRDTGDGQLQTSPDEATWANVPNAKYLHVNADNDPLTGGLTIQSTDSVNPSLIVIEPIATPTSALVSFRKSDNTPIWEILSNLRARFYGSSGNITLDQAGNDLNFSRVGANWLSANTAPGTLTMRVGGINSITAHQNGRSTFGHIEQRDATADILSQNTAWPALSVRVPVGQTANIAEFKSVGGTLSYIAANGSGKMLVYDGNVNSAPNGLVLGHDIGASTPLANFGVGLRYQGKSSTTADQDMALLRAVWEDATHATRKAQVILDVYDTAAREALRVQTDGTQAEIGFFGASPTPRLTLTGDIAGNEALHNLAVIAESFGLIVDSTTDTGVPDPGTTPQFNRSQIASRTIEWMLDFYEYNARAFIDALPLFGGSASFVDTVCAAYLFDPVTMTDWTDAMDTAFDPGDDSEMQAHIDAVNSEKSMFQEALYCALNENGCIGLGFGVTFKDLMATADPDVQLAIDFFSTFSDPGFALMLSSGLLYRCDSDVDLTTVSCDTWEILMLNTSPDVDVITGDTASVGWEFAGSIGTLRLEIPGFHFTSLLMQVYTDDLTPPAEIRVANYGSSPVWHNWTPTSGINDPEFVFDAPAGLQIEVSIDSASGTPIISLALLNTFGRGTPIPDGG